MGTMSGVGRLRRPATRDQQELARKVTALYLILSVAPFAVAVAVPGCKE
jgi:hypothetical protein